MNELLYMEDKNKALQNKAGGSYFANLLTERH